MVCVVVTVVVSLVTKPNRMVESTGCLWVDGVPVGRCAVVSEATFLGRGGDRVFVMLTLFSGKDCYVALATDMISIWFFIGIC